MQIRLFLTRKLKYRENSIALVHGLIVVTVAQRYNTFERHGAKTTTLLVKVSGGGKRNEQSPNDTVSYDAITFK